MNQKIIKYQAERVPQGSPTPTFFGKSTEIKLGYSFQSSSNSREKKITQSDKWNSETLGECTRAQLRQHIGAMKANQMASI